MNEVAVCPALLIVGWTVFRQVYHPILPCNQPTRPAQPCIPPGFELWTLIGQQNSIVLLTSKWKKAINPLSSLRWWSSCLLKLDNELCAIVSSLSIFHLLITLLLKKNFATSNLTLFLFSFSKWPQRLNWHIFEKKRSLSMLSWPFKVFSTSIRSPPQSSGFQGS